MKALILHITDETIDYDRIDKAKIREQIEDILFDSDNATIEEFDDEQNMFAFIHKSLKSPAVGVSACNLWENKTTIYSGYYIDKTEVSDNSQNYTKRNEFASQISSNDVMSTMVIIKQQLTYTMVDNNVRTIMRPCSLYGISEIIDVIESLIIKDGVVITTDGAMRTYTYIMNPIDNLMLTDNDYEKHYVIHNYEVYTHIMIIIADTRQCNGVLNKTATFLAGKPVNGDVYVCLYKKPEFNEDPPFVGLSIENLKIILNIRKKSSVLTTGKEKSDREYANFEKILELEYEKHANKPTPDVSTIQGELLNIK